MRKANTSASAKEKKVGAGRKALVFFGILFLVIGVFLGSFACSFQVMIQAANNTKADEGSLKSENQKLKENILLLQDKISILEAEKGKIEPTTAPTSSSSGVASGATAKPKSTASSSGSSASGTSATKTPSAGSTGGTSTTKSTAKPSAKPSANSGTGSSGGSASTTTAVPSVEGSSAQISD